MLSSVLRSERGVKVNIEIMRAFVRIRGRLVAHKELARKLKKLEERLEKHDEDIGLIFEAIRELMTPPDEPPKKIGFEVSEGQVSYGKKKKQ
jgi:hypothetical protein